MQAHPDIAGLSIRTAAAAGNVEAVQRHLAANPACATTCIPPDFTPPLIYAVESSIKRAMDVPSEQHVAIVRALLDAGATPNVVVTLPDNAGQIPALYFPSIVGNVPVARMLLEHGASPTDGESLYHAAQHDQREILALLQAFGADLSRSPDGATSSPLYFLASHRASNPISASVVGGMHWLLEHGANPNVALSRISDGQSSSQLGEHPLHRVVASGFGADVVELLVKHGATVDAARADGRSAYQLALRTGNASAATALQSLGAATASATPTDHFLAAFLAGREEEARRLLALAPDLMTTLDDEAQRAIFPVLNEGRDEVLHLMLSLGWPLTIESEWGGTPLHWAAWNGRTSLVLDLLARGAPVNQRDSRYGSSPIAWAAHGSRFSQRGDPTAYPAIVTELIAAGASHAAAINRWGEPPERLATDSVRMVLMSRGFVTAVP